MLLAGKLYLRIRRTSRQFLRLQTRESLRNHRFGDLSIEVTHDDKRHVIRHIPSVVELNQSRQTRVLEVLRKTDDITLVRATFVDILHELLIHLRRRVVGIHVILLEHVLQLCLEGTEDRVDETIGEDGQPTVHLSCRERVVICRQVIRRIGIHALRTDEVEHVEEVLGRRDLRFAHRNLIDLRSQLLANFRVRSLAVLVVERDDGVVHRFFCLPIECTDALRALEEHMLQIVRQTCIFSRFIH